MTIMYWKPERQSSVIVAERAVIGELAVSQEGGIRPGQRKKECRYQGLYCVESILLSFLNQQWVD